MLFNRSGARLAIVVLLCAVAAASASAVLAAPADARARWDTRVLALVPLPGYPAMAYVHPNGRIYAGNYSNPNGDPAPSRVFEYDGDGTLLRSWTVQGQHLDKPHGVQVATSDGQGNIVLLEISTHRAILLEPRTGAQTTYATFPKGSVPNYAAWGPDGSLYVTDFANPVLWRVPPGGGAAVEWLRDARFDGGDFGMTGLALQADRRTLVVGMLSQGGGAAGNPTSGRLWTVPIQPDGRPGALRQLWESRPGDGPDGFAIAQSGTIYVALLLTNQLAAIGPDGVERERFPSTPHNGANGSSVPFDSPSSVKFLGTRLIVAQQSFFAGDRSHQALLDVEAGEPGLAELRPPAPAAAAKPPRRAAKKRARAKPRARGRVCRGKGSRRTCTRRAARKPRSAG